MILMNKIVKKDSIFYIYDEDVDIEICAQCNVEVYHYVIDKDVHININLNSSGASIRYYYSHINYNNHKVVMNVVHNCCNTSSNVYNHGVNVNHSKLDFVVNGIIKKDMIKSVCNQENQIINIRDGKSTICPNLLIDCYDVMSSHSAYIGKFDLSHLFYLESRGLSRERAYHLLMKGFLLHAVISDNASNMDHFLEEIYKI